MTIFTDGAARGNPGPGGWGAVIADGVRVAELGGSESPTTNNRMELTAAIEALRLVSEGGSADIMTDSSYLINGATKWIHNWRQNGWKTKTKEPVQNADLWKTLGELLAPREVSWKHVSGHTGIPGNERANDIAEHYADGVPIKLFEGKVDTYPIDLASVRGNEDRTDKRQRSRAQAYSYVSLLDGSIETHDSWEECRRRVHGTPARFRKALSKEDEQRIIREWTTSE